MDANTGRPVVHRLVFVIASTGDASTEEHAEKVKAGIESMGYTAEYVGPWPPGSAFPCPAEPAQAVHKPELL